MWIMFGGRLINFENITYLSVEESLGIGKYKIEVYSSTEFFETKKQANNRLRRIQKELNRR